MVGWGGEIYHDDTVLRKDRGKSLKRESEARVDIAVNNILMKKMSRSTASVALIIMYGCW